ncbi:response regulator transcription factor [Wukongibacter baidiensis]|uniref:response regulator transcription factor n=1 Tax=Wukongibacter baidiensis TaxID=1723361 RepID=UPI003D7FBDFC
MKERILIVEDDIDISEMIQSFLAMEYDFETAFNGVEGLEKASRQQYDMIILDIMMPQMDGIEMLRALRERQMTPILMLSAKDTDIDKALALGFGADDYLEKPFSMIELQARIKAILRRAKYYKQQSLESESNDVFTVGELDIDFSMYQVKRDGVEIKLTSKEFEIFKLLVKNPTRVYTKAQLYNLIWKEEYYGEENVINVHIRRLREKIEENPSKPRYIITLWGIGYKLGEQL